MFNKNPTLKSYREKSLFPLSLKCLYNKSVNPYTSLRLVFFFGRMIPEKEIRSEGSENEIGFVPFKRLEMILELFKK